MNGGSSLSFSEGISLVATCDTQEELDDTWNRLSYGGEEGRCGWLKDRFGVSWQVVSAAARGEDGRPAVRELGEGHGGAAQDGQDRYRDPQAGLQAAMNAAMSSGARRKVTLERTFKASIEGVWDLWTTKEGIESWWGPDGFAVTVHKLDLRPGGELVYAMTAVASDQIEFMKKAGMPLTTESRVTYTDVIPAARVHGPSRLHPRRRALRRDDDRRAPPERGWREDGLDLRRDARRALDADGGDGPGERAGQARAGPRGAKSPGFMRQSAEKGCTHTRRRSHSGWPRSRERPWAVSSDPTLIGAT